MARRAPAPASLVPPPFPSYPSGHATVSGACAYRGTATVLD